MLTSTTDTLQGFEVTDYLGIVTGETISGANIIRDVMATVTDYVGGRSAAYEEILEQARESSLVEMVDRARLKGADAVIGVSLDYEVVGSRGAMLLVTAAGTAVRIRKIG
ncbi:MAG: YbjQ family protein [Alphaproteobacteria bacterium]|nr:YbjQ family protein [Alphaproteobacteria bacterium]